MAASYSRDVALAFVGGFLAALLLALTVGFIALKTSDVYGLGHWKLNARMPLTTMWMNLGYWYAAPVSYLDQSLTWITQDGLQG